MTKRNVLLICDQHLFGESMQSLIQQENKLNLIGPWTFDDDICNRITGLNFDIVLIVGDDPNSKEVVEMTNTIMQHHPDMPIIRTGLTQNTFFVVETHALPASGAYLIAAILGLPVLKWEKSNRNPDQDERSNH